MPDHPVQPQASINRADTNSSELPLSIASSKTSFTTSRHGRFFSWGSFENETSTSKHKIFRSRSKSPALPIPKLSDPVKDATSPPSYISTPQQSPSTMAMSPSSPTSPISPSRPTPGKRLSESSRKNSNDYKHYSGTINHYGRHSNDWLFNGFSVRDTVRDRFDKLFQHDGKEE